MPNTRQLRRKGGKEGMGRTPTMALRTEPMALITAMIPRPIATHSRNVSV